MTRIAFVLFLVLSGIAAAQNPPSLTYGETDISLGMTVTQVQQRLSDGGRHIKVIDTKNVAACGETVRHLYVTALVSGNGSDGDDEGQITFRDGHVIYADYEMPIAHNPAELADEIAGAIGSMKTKRCTVSNFSSHGTGGSHSDSIFDCGLERFVVFTSRLLGNDTPAINVKLEIGGL